MVLADLEEQEELEVAAAVPPQPQLQILEVQEVMQEEMVLEVSVDSEDSEVIVVIMEEDQVLDQEIQDSEVDHHLHQLPPLQLHQILEDHLHLQEAQGVQEVLEGLEDSEEEALLQDLDQDQDQVQVLEPVAHHHQQQHLHQLPQLQLPAQPIQDQDLEEAQVLVEDQVLDQVLNPNNLPQLIVKFQTKQIPVSV